MSGIDMTEAPMSEADVITQHESGALPPNATKVLVCKPM